MKQNLVATKIASLHEGETAREEDLILLKAYETMAYYKRRLYTYCKLQMYTHINSIDHVLGIFYQNSRLFLYNTA